MPSRSAVAPRRRLRPVLALAAMLLAALPAWAAPVPEAEELDVTAKDGTPIRLVYYNPHETGRPGALLLHDYARDPARFQLLAERLLRYGYHVVLVNYRGHGASREATPAATEMLTRHDHGLARLLIQDARAGLDFLTRTQKVPPSKIIVVGAEFGATLAFQLAAEQPQLAGVVALSPRGLAYGIDTLQYSAKYGKRPLLMVSAKSLVQEGSGRIRDQVQKTADLQFEVFPGAEIRGTEMLQQPAAVERLIMAWVQTKILKIRLEF